MLGWRFFFQEHVLIGPFFGQLLADAAEFGDDRIVFQEGLRRKRSGQLGNARGVAGECRGQIIHQRKVGVWLSLFGYQIGADGAWIPGEARAKFILDSPHFRHRRIELHKPIMWRFGSGFYKDVAPDGAEERGALGAIARWMGGGRIKPSLGSTESHPTAALERDFP